MLATIAVGLLVLGAAGLAVRSIWRDKKNGKSCSCGGGCSGCSGACHSRK